MVANRVSWIENLNIGKTKVMKLEENTKLFTTNYWGKIFNYKKPKSINSVPMLYIDNLSLNKPNISNFHNIEFAIRPGEIYGIYDYENLYSEVLLESIVRMIKTPTGRFFSRTRSNTF